MLWQDLREEEFEDAIQRSKGLCVLPMGCLEKHAQHLPVGTDYYTSALVARLASEIEDAVVFPVGFWLGDVTGSHANRSPEKRNKRGYVGLNTKTMLRTMEALCDEIGRNGFDKILIFNGHGGSRDLIRTFIKEQTRKGKPYTTFYSGSKDGAGCQPEPFLKEITEHREEYPMITDTDIAVMQSWVPTGYQGGHANFLETAYIFGERPDLVWPDKYYAEDGLNNHSTDCLTKLGISIKGDWGRRYPNAYSGAAPHGCSESIGQAMIKIHIKRAVRVFQTVKNGEILEF